jgi:hypothetical protein
LVVFVLMLMRSETRFHTHTLSLSLFLQVLRFDNILVTVYLHPLQVFLLYGGKGNQQRVLHVLLHTHVNVVTVVYHEVRVV